MRIRGKIAVAAGLVVAAAAGAAWGQGAPAPATPQPLVVGVVDLGETFKNYKRKAELENEINARKQQLEKEVREKKAKVQELRRQLDLLRADTDEFRDKKYQLMQAMKEAELIVEKSDEQLKRNVETLTLQLLEEIEETVRDYRRKNGIHLVLKADSKGAWGEEKFQERIFRAQVAAVLDHDPALDITANVIAALNDPENLKRRHFR